MPLGISASVLQQSLGFLKESIKPLKKSPRFLHDFLLTPIVKDEGAGHLSEFIFILIISAHSSEPPS